MTTSTFDRAALQQYFSRLVANEQLRTWGEKALHSRWLWAAVAILISSAAIYWGLDDLATTGKVSLTVFAACVIAWSILRLEETPVAIAGGLALIALNATTPEAFYAGMGDNLVWLLIASFILAAVLKQSGVAGRWVMMALCLGQPLVQLSIRALYTRVTWMIIASAFIIPSTSGRAALLLPVYVLIAQLLHAPSARRGLALLFPTVILLSACASLLGAGAHLVAVEMMSQMKLQVPGFAQWASLGVPFAVASSFAAQQLILHLFVEPAEQTQAVTLLAQEQPAFSRQQMAVAGILLTTILLWTFSGSLGLEPALIALLAALAVTTKKLTGISLKEALKAVEWNLILFLAATMVMGEALLHSGAAQALAGQVQELMPQAWRSQPIAIVLFVSLISLLAHCVITSRTARALVLIPTIAVPFAMGEVNVQALIFLSVVASGFCQTFTVSAKPVAMFANHEEAGISAADLWRLSLWLLPVMLVLLLVFSMMVWPALGMPLVTESLTCTR
ncbi:SLC13 family permease [Variovorax sp. PCZ-1]|uniref:SLC13 family permease n=1 Tax=Variovorax sp. PCZ-1 TaxID=2835533 RepID=UPI001BD05A9D|nr:SLC13 family permease [Variovorax sp. PCZ-1]MBS7806508.1 SLC13 family permease [Variovorax sp. PCZ-1]